MQSKMKCPLELRGLRLRTEEGVKYCFSHNLGNPCPPDCPYAHGCMRCGNLRCSAKYCWILKQSDYQEDERYQEEEEPPSTKSWKYPRLEPHSESASSSQNQISSLNGQINVLQQRLEKQEISCAIWPGQFDAWKRRWYVMASIWTRLKKFPVLTWTNLKDDEWNSPNFYEHMAPNSDSWSPFADIVPIGKSDIQLICDHASSPCNCNANWQRSINLNWRDPLWSHSVPIGHSNWIYCSPIGLKHFAFCESSAYHVSRSNFLPKPQTFFTMFHDYSYLRFQCLFICKNDEFGDWWMNASKTLNPTTGKRTMLRQLQPCRCLCCFLSLGQLRVWDCYFYL